LNKSSFNAETIETLVAFANTKGGTVYVGIADSGEPTGISTEKETFAQWLNEIKTKTSPLLIPDIELISHDDKNIAVFTIQEYPVKPVAFRGKYFKRVLNTNHLMTTAEVVNTHLQTFNISWDYHIDNQHNIDDISLDKVQTVIDHINQSGQKITEDPLIFLTKNELIREGYPTHAAYLLFKKTILF